jgi:hypothetical protein
MSTVRVCSTIIHPREYIFASKSDASVYHTVIAKTILNDSVCTCPGWQFRQHCSHVDNVEASQCDWIGAPGSKEEFCPRCGEAVEDYELRPEYT